MKFRTGAVIGFAAGYYLGTKAGRERHEQINRWIHKVTESPSVQEATSKAKQAVGLNGHDRDRGPTWEPDVDLTADRPLDPIQPEVGT
jgi:hypothetical protein